MTSPNGNIDRPPSRSEAAAFLERDFSQCFEQMRHYDSQLWDICKFSFTAYTVLIGVAVGLYQYSLENAANFKPAIVAILIAAFFLGIAFFALAVRNRVYFVVVTRYINEHRKHFLMARPLGFENATRMYTNRRQPPYFNWRSSQSLLLYVISALNGGLLAAVVFVLYDAMLLRSLAVLGIATFVQLICAIIYLATREDRSASRAVFGVDG